MAAAIQAAASSQVLALNSRRSLVGLQAKESLRSLALPNLSRWQCSASKEGQSASVSWAEQCTGKIALAFSAAKSNSLSSTLTLLAASLISPSAARAEDLDDALANLDSTVLEAADGIDPLVLIGAAAAILVPVALFTLFKGKGYAGNLIPADALKRLGEDDTLLLDIRSKEEKKEGSPSLKSVRKKAVSVAFEIEEDEAIIEDPEFATKVAAAKGVSTDSTIVVIDKTGASAVAAAKALGKAGFGKAFAVTGGTDTWKEEGLPWAEPGPVFKVNLDSLRDAITSTVENQGLLPASLGVAAAAGASFVLASEAEVALQLLGSAAVVQLLVKKFLFAEDRKQTIAQLREFFDTKVAPKELVEDLKDIGAALLPELEKKEREAQEAAEAAAQKAAVAVKEEDPAVVKEAAPAVVAEVAANGAAVAEPAAPKSSTDFPPPPRPLSPYAMYPDLKPPTSPTPKPPTPPAKKESEPVAAPAPTPAVEAEAAPPKKSSTDFPPAPRPLSPYAMYPDLKPPTSPTPKPPPAPVAETEAPKAAEPEKKSSTDFPPPPRPLSPYAMYADLKPPTSPTPKPPPAPVAKTEAPKAAEPEKKSSTDFPPPPRPLSPYAMYPDLKPPTSPTPKPPPAPVAETEAPKAAEPEKKSSTDFPPPPRPLSPYAMYPDLKPPTSPTPKPPFPVAKVEAPKGEDAALAAVAAPEKKSSTDFPPPPRPLSPYALYPDLKPPTSPTPSPP